MVEIQQKGNSWVRTRRVLLKKIILFPTLKEAQDLLHWSEAAESLEARESDSHLWFVVVVWIVLWKLCMKRGG